MVIMRRFFSVICLMMVVTGYGTHAFADCADPVRAQGAIMYNTTNKVLQFCNGTDWIAVFNVDSIGSGENCSVPEKYEGDFYYDTTKNVPMFCAGGRWIPLGPLNTTVTGTACTGPAGAEADIVYNTTAQVLQYCNGANWIRLDASLTAEAMDCDASGEYCLDGTYFVDTAMSGQHGNLYTTPCDLGMTWNGSACSGTRATYSWNNGSTNYTITGATDENNGAVNTERLMKLPQTGSSAPWKAAQACADLEYGGHDDWYLPSYQEKISKMNSTVKMPNYNTTSSAYYWTSTEISQSNVRGCTAIGASCTSLAKSSARYVRCMRRD